MALYDLNLELSVCTDCYVAAANGTDWMEGLDAGRELDILAGLDAWLATGYVLAPGDESEGFGFKNSSECAVCHTWLGGDRHMMHALHR